ncbi:MAG: NUDIX domain-containing protein [Ferroplasma sp.]
MNCMAAVALIIDKNSFLLIKRAEQPGDPWSGQMALPGGHKEINEDCEATAKRETMEEVGLKIENLKPLGIYKTNLEKLSVAAFSATSTATDVEIDCEVSAYFWVNFDELIEEGLTYRYKNYVIWGLTFRILKTYIENNQIDIL